MDTEFLESFISVVENGSIASAARVMQVTPNAVSQRIKALEAEIGTRLVARDGRSVRPTEAGAAILERARLLVKHVADLKVAAAQSPGADREIRLGAIASAMTGLLPDVLQRMAVAHPTISVDLVPGSSSQLHRQVLGGEIDAAIIVEPRQALSRTCGWRVLREEPLVVLAHASMRDRPPLELLLSQPYIRYRREECGRRADEYLRHVGIEPRLIFELDGLDAIARMVDRGLGVSIVPNWVQPDAGALSLVRLSLQDARFSRKIGLLWILGSHRIDPLHAMIRRSADMLDMPEADQPPSEPRFRDRIPPKRTPARRGRPSATGG